MNELIVYTKVMTLCRWVYDREQRFEFTRYLQDSEFTNEWIHHIVHVQALKDSYLFLHSGRGSKKFSREGGVRGIRTPSLDLTLVLFIVELWDQLWVLVCLCVVDLERYHSFTCIVDFTYKEISIYCLMSFQLKKRKHLTWVS